MAEKDTHEVVGVAAGAGIIKTKNGEQPTVIVKGGRTVIVAPGASQESIDNAQKRDLGLPQDFADQN